MYKYTQLYMQVCTGALWDCTGICAGVLGASVQTVPPLLSSTGELSSKVGCQTSKQPGTDGASALLFPLAEPCPVQAGAKDRYQGGPVSIWPERLENYLPWLLGVQQSCSGWGWVMLGLCPLQTR